MITNHVSIFYLSDYDFAQNLEVETINGLYSCYRSYTTSKKVEMKALPKQTKH